ncbi:MAG: hypothetical protein QOJ12_1620 [Thermoleophilales bacterium]|nr:hypothetical protein [Thermoleophilales bacterium]
MNDLTTTTGIVALAAGGLALVTLAVTAVLAVKLKRMRANQLAVLGATEKGDLAAHANRLETGFTDLREWVEESLAGSERRMVAAEQRIDGCIAYTAMVRYDAYNELSGAQSASMAMLDTHRNGIVLTSIVHRDQARIYVKQLVGGDAEIELSPEEQQAVERALGTPASA